MMIYWHEFNNFDDEATMDVLCEKIEIVFKTKNSMNKVLVFRNIVRFIKKTKQNFETKQECM